MKNILTKNQIIFAASLLCFLSITIYAQALNFPFIFDDYIQIVNNPIIHSITNIPKLFTSSTFYAGNINQLNGTYYRPIMMTAFSLIFQISQLNPFGYHLVQISLHTVNALLLYFLLRKTNFSHTKALSISSIFLVHPINTETVIYISNLQDILTTFFGLASFYYLQTISLKLPKQQRIISLLYILTLLSKESGIIILIVAQIYLYLTQKPKFFTSIKILIVTLIGYLILRYLAIGLPPADQAIPIVSSPLSTKLATIPKIMFTYISTYFWPNDLTISQNWIVSPHQISQIAIPLFSLFALGTLAIITLQKMKKQSQERLWGTLAISGVVLNLLLHSNFIPLDATVALRWFYIGSLFLTIFCIITLSYFAKRIFKPALFTIIILVLTIASYSRTKLWEQPLSLLLHDYQTSKPNFIIANSIAFEYLNQNDYTHALQYIDESINHVSNWGPSWNSKGYALEHLYRNGQPIDPLEIMDAYLNSVKYFGDANSYINLSNFLVDNQIKNYEQTKNVILNGLAMYPQHPDLWFLLSKLELQNNNYEESRSAAEQLVRFSQTPAAQQWLNSIPQEHNL